MKFLKIVLKIFITSVLIMALVIAGMSLYVKFYGKAIIENAISNMIGAKVKFKGISLDFSRKSVNFRGFSILSEIDLGSNVLNADKFILTLNKEKLEKEKKMVFDEIFILNGVFNIARDKNGFLSVAYKRPEDDAWDSGLAYAEEPQNIVGLYNFAANVKKLKAQNCAVNFKDHYIANAPFTVTCKNLNMEVISGDTSQSGSGYIPMKCVLSFVIPGKRFDDGQFLLNANLAAYKHKVDMEMKIKTQYIEVLNLVPYLDRYTPFYFRGGVFSSTTNFRMHDNMIDSLTTVLFNKLNLYVNPNKENAVFLETSVNKLAPYLMSGRDGLIFDFVIQGPLVNPKVGLGPQVRYAIGAVAVQEVGKIIQQIQKLKQ